MQTTAKQSTDKIDTVSGKPLFPKCCWQKQWLTTMFNAITIYRSKLIINLHIISNDKKICWLETKFWIQLCRQFKDGGNDLSLSQSGLSKTLPAITLIYKRKDEKEKKYG